MCGVRSDLDEHCWLVEYRHRAQTQVVDILADRVCRRRGQLPHRQSLLANAGHNHSSVQTSVITYLSVHTSHLITIQFLILIYVYV